MCETENGWYFDLVDNAIMSVRKRLDYTSTQRQLSMMSLLSQILELRSVKIDVGRQVGKTSYILSRVKEDDIIIPAYPRLRNYVGHDNVLTKGKPAVELFQKTMIQREWRNRMPSIIYFDDWSKYKEIDGEWMRLIGFLADRYKNSSPLFVMLG